MLFVHERFVVSFWKQRGHLWLYHMSQWLPIEKSRMPTRSGYVLGRDPILVKICMHCSCSPSKSDLFLPISAPFLLEIWTETSSEANVDEAVELCRSRTVELWKDLAERDPVRRERILKRHTLLCSNSSVLYCNSRSRPGCAVNR